MSRIYNKLALHLDYDYGRDDATFEIFLNIIKHELGWYDKAHTIPMFDFDEINYVSEDDTNPGAWYEITDYNQTIDPDKLQAAFDEWWDIGEDVDDDAPNRDEIIEEKKSALIGKLIYHIKFDSVI